MLTYPFTLTHSPAHAATPGPGFSPCLTCACVRAHIHAIPCLQELDPALVSHLLHLGCLPASLAMPWLCSGFVGALGVEEVLLLWDRVVGMDSLLPLALLAVAVLCFR